MLCLGPRGSRGSCSLYRRLLMEWCLVLAREPVKLPMVFNVDVSQSEAALWSVCVGVRGYWIVGQICEKAEGAIGLFFFFFILLLWGLFFRFLQHSNIGPRSSGCQSLLPGFWEQASAAGNRAPGLASALLIFDLLQLAMAKAQRCYGSSFWRWDLSVRRKQLVSFALQAFRWN